MNPILIVLSLFSMSLLAAFVLFKSLKNSAVVKLPFGRFGGAIAGFIGVYLLLSQSYTGLLRTKDEIKLQIPANFKEFVSRDYEFGLGYPQHFNDTRPRNMINIASFLDKNSRVSFTIAVTPFRNFDVENISTNEVRKHLIESLRRLFMERLKGYEIVSEYEHSVQGMEGKVFEIQNEIGKEKRRVFLLILPNFSKKTTYFLAFNIPEEDAKTQWPMFENILSTIQFF